MRASARVLRRATVVVDRASAEYREAAGALRSQMLATRRRVRASPTLRPEDVAVPAPVQRAVEALVAQARADVSVTRLRAASKRGELARAPEAQHRMLKRFKAPSNAPVLPPPDYTKTAEAVAYAATRTPGTRAAAVHVLRELRRIKPTLDVERTLDFGAGAGAATAAAVSVFDGARCATLVEEAAEMRRIGQKTLGAEPRMEGVEARWVSSLQEGDDSNADEGVVDNSDIVVETDSNVVNGHDLVMSTYTLSELARTAMVRPEEEGVTRRDHRANHASKRVRRAVRRLWKRTAAGGHVVIVEDGTAAGFETVLLARDALVRAGGQVVAPCLHSGRCALEGSVTRHRVCRFVQRLNRPLFLRVAKPHHDGFEDELFSYVVVHKPRDDGDGEVPEKMEAEAASVHDGELSQKTDVESATVHDDELSEKTEVEMVTVQDGEVSEKTAPAPVHDGWGRLVRSPLLRNKHVVLDACLRDGSLERYTITKNNSEPGMYNVARKARWGDVWPQAPKGNPQPVHF